MSEHQYTVVERFRAQDIRKSAVWLAERVRHLRVGQAVAVDLILQAHMPYSADVIVVDTPFIYKLLISERSMGLVIFLEYKEDSEFVLRCPSRLEGEEIAGIRDLRLIMDDILFAHLVPILSQNISNSVERVRRYMRLSAVKHGFRDLGLDPDDPDLAVVLERAMLQQPPTPVSP
jgi:hypothetical protein